MYILFLEMYPIFIPNQPNPELPFLAQQKDVKLHVTWMVPCVRPQTVLTKSFCIFTDGRSISLPLFPFKFAYR